MQGRELACPLAWFPLLKNEPPAGRVEYDFAFQSLPAAGRSNRKPEIKCVGILLFQKLPKFNLYL